MEEPSEGSGDRLLRELLMPRNNSSNVTFSINAGGIGVWIACACCAVMLASMLVAAFWLSREFTRIDNKFSDAKNTADIQQAWIDKLKNKPKPENK